MVIFYGDRLMAIEEFESQINLAENIWRTNLPGKERVSFVLLDNVIEFMSKYYLKVVRKLVGKGKNKISPNDWDDISRFFPRLVNVMKNHSPIPHPTLDIIKSNHDMRNDLYHASVPMAVNRSLFLSELRCAIEAFETLYRKRFNSSVIDVDSILRGKPVLETLLTVVGSDQYIRVDYSETWPLMQWIRVIIHGYISLLGVTPGIDQMMHSLAISNQPTDDKKVRQSIHKLKFDGDVKEASPGLYSLTQEGLEKTLRNR